MPWKVVFQLPTYPGNKLVLAGYKTTNETTPKSDNFLASFKKKSHKCLSMYTWEQNKNILSTATNKNKKMLINRVSRIKCYSYVHMEW